jgi:hypothetical protein
MRQTATKAKTTATRRAKTPAAHCRLSEGQFGPFTDVRELRPIMIRTMTSERSQVNNSAESAFPSPAGDAD